MFGVDDGLDNGVGAALVLIWYWGCFAVGVGLVLVLVWCWYWFGTGVGVLALVILCKFKSNVLWLIFIFITDMIFPLQG